MKAVFRVLERRTLGASHLRDILLWVTGMHPETAILIDTHSIANLADRLRAAIGEGAASNVTGVAQRMADVATMVYKSGHIIKLADQHSANADRVTFQICSEYAIACAISFGASCKFELHYRAVPYSSIAKALLDHDWELLSRTFEESIREGGRRVGRPEPSYTVDESAEVIISRIESQFAVASPIPEPSPAQRTRQLSAESYWNLRAEAEKEHWTLRDMIALIDEHLNPQLHPNLVHYSRTVAGEEWLRLYRWIHRHDGRVL
jgi:hypothetical protein